MCRGCRGRRRLARGRAAAWRRSTPARATGCATTARSRPARLADSAAPRPRGVPPERVWSGGELVADGGEALRFARRARARLGARHGAHRAAERRGPCRPRRAAARACGSIGIVPTASSSPTRIDEPRPRRRPVVAEPGADLAKIAVVERHHATGRIGTGFVHRLRPAPRRVRLDRRPRRAQHRGGGHRRRDMLACVSAPRRARRRHRRRRGAATVRGELALPVAGLLSDARPPRGRRAARRARARSCASRASRSRRRS